MKSEITNIDGYPVERKLGEGASGTVYLVRLPGRQRHAALKILKGRSDPGEILRFRREFGAVARCNHPEVVSVYGIGEFKASPYFLMEYVKGTDILSSLRQSLRARAVLPKRGQTHLISLMKKALIRISDFLFY